MKKIRWIFKYGVFLIFALLFASCEGDEGPVGPKGNDGNLNVKSIIIDVSKYTGNYWYIPVPQLTQEIIDRDAILMYLKYNNFWYPIPGNGPNGAYEIRCYYSSGWVNIKFLGHDGTPYSGYTALEELRIVIIESSFRIGEGPEVLLELEQAGIDLNSYDEIAGYYGLEM